MGYHYIIQCLILPPGLFIITLLMGLVGIYFHRKIALWWLLACIIALYTLSVPKTTTWLAKYLQHYPPLTTMQIQHSSAQAIVVLSAGRYFNAPEYGGDTASTITLLRLRYAAHIHQINPKPILLSGGAQAFHAKPDAQLMKQALWNDFHVKSQWLETRSSNTWENAKYSFAILKKNHISSIFLVTSAIHMPRAMLAFEKYHISAIPAPTFFIKKPHLEHTYMNWLPNRFALFSSTQCLYEYIGLIWYHLMHA